MNKHHQPPTCFISYSHDTEEHKLWVRQLASRLAEYGVAVRVDQNDVFPGIDLAQYMEDNLETSDFVIVVCTPSYREKASKRIGGVGWEAMIVTRQLYSRTARPGKYVPLVRRGSVDEAVPLFLGTDLALDFRDSANLSASLATLLRHLLDKPEFRLPELGKPPDFEAGEEVVWEPATATQAPQVSTRKRQSSTRTRTISTKRSTLLSNDVLINCNDPTTRRAIMFSVMFEGFRPRAVLELKPNSRTDNDRFFAVLAACTYAIHYFPAGRGDASHDEAIFQLGAFEAVSRFATRRARSSLILSSGRSMPLLARYGGVRTTTSATSVVQASSEWLRYEAGHVNTSGNDAQQYYKQFARDFRSIERSVGLTERGLSYIDLAYIISAWLKSNPLR